MTDKKSKNICIVNGIFYGHFAGTTEIVHELVSLGHNVSCYVLEDFKDRLKNSGAKIIPYDIDKNQVQKRVPKQAPPFAVSGYILADATAILFNLISNDKNKYDYYIFDSFFEITEMNKIMKIDPAKCISLYSENIFTDENFNILAERRKHAFDVVNKMFNLNFHDYITNAYTPSPYKKLILNSKLFHLRSENADDKCFFIGPSIEKERKIDINFNFKKDKSKKLIYVSFGTLYFNLDKKVNVFLNCINAFKDSEEYQVVLSIGKYENKNLYRDLPKNISVFEFVPQLQLLPEVDVFITHGGLNSIGEALFNRVPLIVVPFFIDQFDNARKIEELGAGIYLDKTKTEISEEVIKKAVNEISTNNEKYKVGMEKIIDSFNETRANRKNIYEKIFI